MYKFDFQRKTGENQRIGIVLKKVVVTADYAQTNPNIA